jgi:hypothetical protein
MKAPPYEGLALSDQAVLRSGGRRDPGQNPLDGGQEGLEPYLEQDAKREQREECPEESADCSTERGTGWN